MEYKYKCVSNSNTKVKYKIYSTWVNVLVTFHHCWRCYKGLFSLLCFMSYRPKITFIILQTVSYGNCLSVCAQCNIHPNEQSGLKEINKSHFRVSQCHRWWTLCTLPFQSLWQIKTSTLVAADTTRVASKWMSTERDHLTEWLGEMQFSTSLQDLFLFSVITKRSLSSNINMLWKDSI